MKSDFIIVHVAADLDRANKLCKQLNSLGYEGSLFNEHCLIQDLNRARHVLLCISKSFSDKNFLGVKKVVTDMWLKTRKFRINPVHLDTKIHLDEKVKGHFYGLMQFSSFYFGTKHFESDVKKEFEKYLRL